MSPWGWDGHFTPVQRTEKHPLTESHPVPPGDASRRHHKTPHHHCSGSLRLRHNDNDGDTASSSLTSSSAAFSFLHLAKLSSVIRQPAFHGHQAPAMKICFKIM